MSKETKILSYAVVVSVATHAQEMWSHAELTSEQQLRAANRIKAAIERHLSHDLGKEMDGVNVIATCEYVCSHCGYKWGEDDIKYNGGCCEEDEKGKP